MYGAVGVTKETFLRLIHDARKDAFTSHNIASGFRKAGLHPFNPDQVLRTLRPTTPPTAAAVLRDPNGNEVRMEISCPDTASRVNEIVSQVRAGSQDKVLIEEVCSIAVEAVAKKNLAYKQCDKMIEKGKQRRRQAKPNRHCGEARGLTIGAIREMGEQIAAKELQESIAKERKLALYGKGKFAQLVWKEIPVSLDVFK
jgi:predicted nucleic acid-binding Zn ribbon protein